MTYAQTSYTPADSQATGKRLDNIGWAVFFILTGALWLVPESQVPPGTWFIGVGLLLLGAQCGAQDAQPAGKRLRHHSGRASTRRRRLRVPGH